MWRDLQGDVDEFFEFVATGINAPTRAFFETCMYRAMYERKYRKSADNVQDAELEQFLWHPPAPAKVNPRRKVSRKSAAPIQPSAGAPIILDEDKTPPMSRSQVDDAFMALMTVLFEKKAELYFWDVDEDGFRNDGIVMAKILKQDNANCDYVYWLTASNDGMILAHRITLAMNQRFSHKMRSLTWNHMGENNTQSSWVFRFAEEKDFASVVQIFTQCQWETLHQISWSKAKVEEQNHDSTL